MTAVRFLLLFLFANALHITELSAQTDNETDVRIDFFGSVATGDYTPLWLVSNHYGVTPLKANNGYTRAALAHRLSLSGMINITAAVDAVATTSRYRNVFLQQCYAEAAYKMLSLTVGSKENYISILDPELSSGDMVISQNARPFPQINIAVPQFTVIPFTHGWLQFRANFAAGRAFDRDYLRQYYGTDYHYSTNTLWHHKSLHLRLADTNGSFPFTAILGVRHLAQWGSVDGNSGAQQPHAFSDFIRIVLAKQGDETADEGEQINVLGNHVGSYDLKLGFLNTSADVYLYKQHYFDDASGMELDNLPDGLFGLQINLHNSPVFNRIVLEYLNTRDQSGPLHFINFDHERFTGYGGGADDYYNNYNYAPGVAHFNRTVGTPLIASPEYYDIPHFCNNRLTAIHLGLSGRLSQQLAYRLLTTAAKGWGTPFRPLLHPQQSFSVALKSSYTARNINNWLFSLELAADKGQLFNSGCGAAISASKLLSLKNH